ncbi:ragulator complex protein LAMTOR1-like [Babylonia areolata]|uniref:ragulator complex protein LAMTOR1-like n=1 Tax=Babylonia areolata TaxID=304850 RepID=UPI003FD5D11D
MGCSWSCCYEDDKDPVYPEPDERTRLLDPTLGDASAPSLRNPEDQPFSQDHDKGDEQSVMARILHQNAREVIDVASSDNTIEQHEYHDRARQYNTRLKLAMAKRGSFRLTLPPGVTSPQSVLAAPPVSPAEIHLICNAAEKMSKAMRDVRIQHREDLVVSFGVPVP